MKNSIRNIRFTMGMILFLAIILLLSVSSAFYLNRLSGKTNAILKENHHSVVYAREMSENLTNINIGIINSILSSKNPDTVVMNKAFMLFDKSLEFEKNNITEPGEDVLVSGIETDYHEYRDSVAKFIKSPEDANLLALQTKFETLYQSFMRLSQMNEKAIEVKTDNAKVTAKKAAFRMTFIGTICFLIAYGFTFSFSSYFNERFYNMYNGIKDIVSSDYRQRLNIEGNDELSEISLVFNEMAVKLDKTRQKTALNLSDNPLEDDKINNIQELKSLLLRINSIGKQATELISRLEK
jgi:methyl-accepting chemotaxis protein